MNIAKTIRRIWAHLNYHARPRPTSQEETHYRTLLKYGRDKCIHAFTLRSCGWSVDDIGFCMNVPTHKALDLIGTGEELARGTQ